MTELNEMREYAAQLKKVLITFDTDRMRGFVRKHRDLYSETALHFLEHNGDDWLLGTMAKMVIARTDISEEHKAKAREILDRMGWSYDI